MSLASIFPPTLFRFTWKSMQPVTMLISRCPKLTHLDLSLNPISPPAATNENALSSFHLLPQSLEVSRCSHLSVLDLSCLRLTDDDIAGLLECSIAKRISKLYLRSNDLHDETVVRLGRILPAMAVQVLCLAGNHIGNRGLGALAFAIDQTKTLQTLDLEENQVWLLLLWSEIVAFSSARF